MKERMALQEQPTSAIIEVGKEMIDRLEEIRNSRIKLEGFINSGLIKAELIRADLEYVKNFDEREKRKEISYNINQSEVHKNAEIIEAMFPMIIRDFEWLGKNTNIIYTSRYDDIVNGIDSIAELVDSKKTVTAGLEIDFTSSEAEMMDKIMKIRKKIESGVISKVKYFESPTTGRSMDKEMPKIAFGASKNEMSDFVEIVAEAYMGKKREEAREKLRNHPIKKKFIKLAMRQLENFANIAEESGHPENAELHRNVLEILKERNLLN